MVVEAADVEAHPRWDGQSRAAPRTRIGIVQLLAMLTTLALMLAGCAGLNLAPAPPARTTISGVVYGDSPQDQEAGRTVLVPLSGTVTCDGVTATIHADGSYSLVVATAQHYTCLASAPSYQSAQAEVAGSAGAIARLDFGGATQLASCVTGAAALAATATAGAANPPISVPTATRRGASSEPSAAPAAVTQCPELRLIPGSVAGSVTRAEDGSPAARVRVTCWQPGGPTQTSGTGNTYKATTDVAGRFAFTHMPIAQYLCTAGDDPGAFTVSPTPSATTSAAFKMCTTSCPDVHYGQGDVMHTMTAYLLFWLPHGRTYSEVPNNSYETVIQHYFQDVGGSAYYNIVSQYWDTTNGFMANSVKLGDVFVDTTAYPHGATSQDPLLDKDITHEIAATARARHWTNDTSHIVFVYTAYGAEVCANAPVKSCSFQQPGGDTFCGYHSNMPDQTIYAVLPDSAACVGPAYADTYSGPNGDRLADVVIIYTSHEQFEAATDPFQGGWWGLNPHQGEVGDKCAGHFSTVTLRGGSYLVQAEWSNRANRCVYAL